MFVQKNKVAITGTTSGIGQSIVKKLSHCDITELNRPKFNLLDDAVLDSIALDGYDVLINNAGADYDRQDFLHHQYQHWKDTVKINFTVPMYLTQKFMQQNTKGIVINITTNDIGKGKSTVFYRASKSALSYFIKEINSENNIRVVDIQPAKTKTNFIANAGQIPDYTNNTLDPEHVADAVIYAISAPHITQISLKNDFIS